MMATPEKPVQTEEVFEWANVDGKIVKITKENSNGRICAGCKCSCPCNCADCKPVCCSSKHESKSKKDSA